MSIMLKAKMEPTALILALVHPRLPGSSASDALRAMEALCTKILGLREEHHHHPFDT